jgi:hypothetical protein
MRFSSSRWLMTMASLLTYSVTACGGKVVDLGDNRHFVGGPVYSTGSPVDSIDASSNATADPFRIVDREHAIAPSCWSPERRIPPFTVNSGRLYWLSGSSAGAPSYALRSCDIENCAGTLVASAPVPLENGYCLYLEDEQPIELDGDTAYWLHTKPFLLKRASTASGAAAVDVQVDPGRVGRIVIDHGVIYFASSSGTVLRCDAPDCVGTLRRFDMNPPTGSETYRVAIVLAQDAEYLYLLDRPNTVAWRVVRVLKDDSRPFEVLLETPLDIGQFELQGESFYWLEPIALGRLLSCPKSGCSGSPTVLVEGLNSPTSLAVDDEAVYLSEPPELVYSYGPRGVELVNVSRPGRLLSCPKTGCASPTVLHTGDEFSIGRLLVDDRFLYFGGSDCKPDETFEQCRFVSVIPKR